VANPAIAIKLAKEHGLTDLVPKPDPLAGFLWESVPTLTPGLDYRNGVVYMTFPGQRTVEKKFGRGKEAYTKQVPEACTICVTSERQTFFFDEETLLDLGWSFPRTFMQNPNDTAWALEDLRVFVQQETPEPDPFDIWQRIRGVYQEYIEFSEPIHYDLMSIYVMMTYVFRLFQAVPYIHFHGTREAGKSQNMGILKALAFNPIWQSSITPASMFRTLGGSVGTVMIDEAENWDSEANQELLRILKAGYYEGAGVLRTERDGNERFVPVNYPAYSPKVIASINPQDPVLASRCIVVNMRPAIKALPNFVHSSEEWRPLRNDLYLYAMHHTAKIETTLPEWEEDKRQKYAPDLRNRQWQIAKPLLVLADYIGGDLLVEPLAKYLAEYWASATRNANVVDRQALLLRVLPRLIRDVGYSEDHFYPVKEIHRLVTEYLDEEEAKTYKSRSVLRYLAPLGFVEKRNSRTTGVLVQIKEDQVRTAFVQRRLEPFDDDADWLDGKISYEREQQPPPDSPASLWEDGDDNGETNSVP
jgi:hypothetical protein